MKPSSDLREQSLHLLRLAVGHNADFRDGQWEAIESLVRRCARLLVVQRTGWGKSIVYFLTTRLLRDQGAGPAYGREIDTFIFFHRCDDVRSARPLADHALEPLGDEAR